MPKMHPTQVLVGPAFGRRQVDEVVLAAPDLAGLDLLGQTGQLIQAVGHIAVLPLHDAAPVQGDAQLVRLRAWQDWGQVGPVLLQAPSGLQGFVGV